MSNGHIVQLVKALAVYDEAVLKLEEYLGLMYAPYELEEPTTPSDRQYNEHWYRETNNLKVMVQRATADLITALRRELEGMS